MEAAEDTSGMTQKRSESLYAVTSPRISLLSVLGLEPTEPSLIAIQALGNEEYTGTIMAQASGEVSLIAGEMAYVDVKTVEEVEGKVDRRLRSGRDDHTPVGSGARAELADHGPRGDYHFLRPEDRGPEVEEASISLTPEGITESAAESTLSITPAGITLSVAESVVDDHRRGDRSDLRPV